MNRLPLLVMFESFILSAVFFTIHRVWLHYSQRCSWESFPTFTLCPSSGSSNMAVAQWNVRDPPNPLNAPPRRCCHICLSILDSPPYSHNSQASTNSTCTVSAFHPSGTLFAPCLHSVTCATCDAHIFTGLHLAVPPYALCARGRLGVSCLSFRSSRHVSCILHRAITDASLNSRYLD